MLFRSASVLSIEAEDGETMTSAPHPKQKLWVKLDKRPEVFDLLRRCEDQAVVSDVRAAECEAL